MTPDVAVIGAGPAGLFAAERLAMARRRVAVFDAMPSAGRKFLLAGRGGLNLTHAEPLELFLPRYGAAQGWLEPMIRAFPPAALRDWADGLGAETFVGSSGRVFPRAMKASPLLRTWLGRLRSLGVSLRLRHRWTGWTGEALAFATPDGPKTHRPAATLLALGGASWPRLGSDGAWVGLLRAEGVPIADLAPANMGVHIAWRPDFAARFAGCPLKGIAATAGGTTVRGEAMVTATGLEGQAVYALGPALRRPGARLVLDLRPDAGLAELAARLARVAGHSRANALRRALGLAPAAIALLAEAGVQAEGPQALARAVKGVALDVAGVAGLARAISTAGGIRQDGVDTALRLHARPDVAVCGEMLDWEAPTGGYLLQACFATASWAAAGLMGPRGGLSSRPS